MLTTTLPSEGDEKCSSSSLQKKINSQKDVVHFKTKSPAYKDIVSYVDSLCEHIQGTGNRILNHRYVIENHVFKRCSSFLDELARCCDETDLNLAQSAGTLRFGHVAFRTWFDKMRLMCQDFTDDLLGERFGLYKEELSTYLSESFGNRMRIDYGTGHELSFLIFTMGLSNVVEIRENGGDKDAEVETEKLRGFVKTHGWDILSLFAHKYLRLCRKLQTKFRLEPAGSRGVYNMDDFQFLPFLFGAAQLSGVKHILTSEFHLAESVEDYKRDYIFFEAVDFILNNKRGPFNEHSYTLWGFTNLGSWDNIYRRIRGKFKDEILEPFPIVQHFLFGRHILRWEG